MPIPAALGGRTLASVIDKNSTHHLRRHPEELPPVLPLDAGLVNQAEVGLVNQRRGAERVIRPFAPNRPPGQPAKFLIKQGK
jgi:hypothetical protein